MTCPPTPKDEVFQRSLHLLLYAMGYAPLRTWVAPGFVFITFPTEEKAGAALSTFAHVSWARESYLKHEQDGTPYITVRCES